jgi:hypothetical protein
MVDENDGPTCFRDALKFPEQLVRGRCDGNQIHGDNYIKMVVWFRKVTCIHHSAFLNAALQADVFRSLLSLSSERSIGDGGGGLVVMARATLGQKTHCRI